METRLKSLEIEKMKEKIGLFNMLAVDCVEEGRKRSGGLTIFGEILSACLYYPYHYTIWTFKFMIPALIIHGDLQVFMVGLKIT